MYPVLIITFLASIYLSLMNPIGATNMTEVPSPFERDFEAKSFGLGQDFAEYVSGVQRLIARYEIDPTFVGTAELAAEITANAGFWEIDWAEYDAFITGSAYATGVGLTRADLFPLNFEPPANFTVVVIGQRDGGGVLTGAVGAIVGYADMDAADLEGLDGKSFLQGASLAFNGSANIGIVKNNRLAARGYLAAQIIANGASFGAIPGGAGVPAGAVGYIRCYVQLDASVANDMCEG